MFELVSLIPRRQGPVDGVGMFFGAGVSTSAYNYTLRLNRNGVIQGTEGSYGTARRLSAGAGLENFALFYGGTVTGGSTLSNLLTVFDGWTSTILQREDVVGTARTILAGAGSKSRAFFYGGRVGTVYSNHLARFNDQGMLDGSELTVGTDRGALAGAGSSTTALFYGGRTSSPVNTLTRFNWMGSLLFEGSTAAGIRDYFAAGWVESRMVAYAGRINNSSVNHATSFTDTGSVAQTAGSTGTARFTLAGTGVGDTAIFRGGHNTSTDRKTTFLTSGLVQRLIEQNVGTRTGAQSSAAGSQ